MKSKNFLVFLAAFAFLGMSTLHADNGGPGGNGGHSSGGGGHGGNGGNSGSGHGGNRPLSKLALVEKISDF